MRKIKFDDNRETPKTQLSYRVRGANKKTLAILDEIHEKSMKKL